MPDIILDWERPPLYPKQLAAIYEKKRISCIEASTKAGKTSACIPWITEQAMRAPERSNHWWVGPVSDQSRIAFTRMLQSLAGENNEGAIRFTATRNPMRILLPGNRTVWFKSGDHPDSLFGEDVYSAVIDEASRVKEESWHAVRTTLTYTRGPIRIIGNVKGKKNWFYRLARRAEIGDPQMAFHRLTAWDAVAAGVLARREIENARSELPGAVFRELYEAEAADDEGNPFGYDNIDACVAPLSGGRPYVWGWDFARKRDFTVGIALDANGRCCRFHRFQKPWRETIDLVLREVGFTPAVVDATAMGGDMIVEELQRRGGSQYQGYVYTGPKKQILMEGLAMALSNRAVSYPDGTIPMELKQFEYEYTRNGVRYTAPEGFWDDCVCALAEAVWGMTHRVGGYDLETLAS